MEHLHFPMKDSLLAEQSNGRFKLLDSGSPRVPVSDIEFQNRKAARNWAKSRGIRIIDTFSDSTLMHGPN